MNTLVTMLAFLVAVMSVGTHAHAVDIQVENDSGTNVRVMFVANQKGANHFIDLPANSKKKTSISPPKGVDQVFIAWDRTGKLLGTATVVWDTFVDAKLILVRVESDGTVGTDVEKSMR